MSSTRKTTKAATTRTSFEGFSDEERAAMKEHAEDLKTAARRGSRTTREDGENDVREKIETMAPPDRVMAERVHAIVSASAPGLEPRLWYGMPAYAKNGKVVCFFQSAEKFKSRYATLGFSDQANLDEGTMWPTSFALTKLTKADEARIAALVQKAVS
jgi:uncharacterized protein YdhG (YjbR/CyaY superfamily)